MLYAFISYIARVVEPLIQITMQFSQLQQAVVAAARVNTLLRRGRSAAGARAAAQVERRARSASRDAGLRLPAGRGRCCTA